MNSAKLTSCIECGRSISTTARQCPGCGTKIPHGIVCKICGKPGKISTIKTTEDTVSRYDDEINEYFYWQEYKSYHTECYEKVFEVNYSCPVCCHNITKFQKHCPQCAHPFTVNQCVHCGQLALKDISVISAFYGRQTLHKFCADIRNPNWEREEQNLLEKEQRRREEEQRRREEEQRRREEEQRRREEAKVERKRKEEEEIRQSQEREQVKQFIQLFSTAAVVFLFVAWYNIVIKSFFNILFLLILGFGTIKIVNSIIDLIFRDK